MMTPQLCNTAALFIGALVMTEVIGTGELVIGNGELVIGNGELVIGAVERTEETSFKQWTYEMMDCMNGCLDINIKCRESCQTEAGRIKDCIEKKCDDGILLCREFCDTVYSDDILKRGNV